MMKLFGNRSNNLQYEFLPAALEIEEAPPSPLGKTIIWLIVLIIAAFIAWACMGKVDEVAVARGEIIPESKVKAVQPLTGGVVTSINVKEGQHVDEGDILISLNSSELQTKLDSAGKSLELLNFENELIQYILNNNGSVDKFSNASDFSDSEKDLMAYYLSEEKNQNLKKQAVMFQISQTQPELDIEKINLESLKKDLENAQDNYKKAYSELNSMGSEENLLAEYKEKLDDLMEQQKEKEQLFNQGEITQDELNSIISSVKYAESMYNAQKLKAESEKTQKNSSYVNSTKQVESLKMQINSQQLKLEEIENKVNELKTNLSYLDNDRLTNLKNVKSQNNTKIDDLIVAIQNLKTGLNNNDLKAPVNGTVQNVSVTTIGNVVTSAQPLLSIVPDDDNIIAEVTVANKDIGYIKMDQNVSIKMDTFSFQKYGVIEGKVIYISPDASKDDSGNLFYIIKVSLQKNSLIVDGVDTPISAGMSLTAEIKTGKRRIIEFFLEPIMKNIKESVTVR